MTKPKIVYAVCLLIYTFILNVWGKGFPTYQYWIGASLIITAYLCGKIEAYREEDARREKEKEK